MAISNARFALVIASTVFVVGWLALRSGAGSKRDAPQRRVAFGSGKARSHHDFFGGEFDSPSDGEDGDEDDKEITGAIRGSNHSPSVALEAGWRHRPWMVLAALAALAACVWAIAMPRRPRMTDDSDEVMSGGEDKF